VKVTCFSPKDDSLVAEDAQRGDRYREPERKNHKAEPTFHLVERNVRVQYPDEHARKSLEHDIRKQMVRRSELLRRRSCHEEAERTPKACWLDVTKSLGAQWAESQVAAPCCRPLALLVLPQFDQILSAKRRIAFPVEFACHNIHEELQRTDK
jgi:hypothetical protein